MITKWKVFNFKSIRKETELDLGQLTIFAGANSSGKSTIVQSILLIAQTLSSKLSSRSVVLNGALTSLGQFDDLKSNGSKSDQIAIKCTCRPSYDHGVTIRQRSAIAAQKKAFYYDPRSTLQEIECEISFDADPSSPQRDIFQIQPRLFSSRLICTSKDEDNTDQKAEISIRHSKKTLSEVRSISSISGIDDQLRAGLAYSVELDEASMAEVKEEFHSARTKECVLRHFLPELIIYEIDMIEENARAITRALRDDIWRGVVGFRRHLGRDIPLSEEIVSVLRDTLQDTVNFDEIFYQPESLFGYQPLTSRFLNERLWRLSPDIRIKIREALRQSDDLFGRILEAMRTSSPSSSQPRDLVRRRPPRQISEATKYLDNFFTSSLKYLGPLRDAPKPLYPLAPAADPNDVGLRGEHTAAILDLHKNKRIRYIPSTNFRTPAVDRSTVTKTLEAAVIDWLEYLGVASSIKSQDQGKLGHELKVGLDSSEVLHDLTHVGVGVSQVLPILVMSLLADSDSTLVFEQPELHLHPKVQTLLSDFFISMALCNKQCVVETHSEYFIDRLRFRIAAASSESELNSQAKIYFVEKSSQGSLFREVVINEYGAISDWPEGFFDQSQQQAEEILRAAAAKRKGKRDNEVASMLSVTIDAGVLAVPQPTCTYNDVYRYIDTLLDWKKLLDEPWVAIYMSERASEALIEDSLFPFREQLNQLFCTHGIEEYDVNTVASVVNRLLAITPFFETYYHLKDVLTEHLETEPDILKLTTCDGLQTDLARCVVLIAILRKHCSQPLGGHSLILREAPKDVVKVRAQIHCLEHERDDIP